MYLDRYVFTKNHRKGGSRFSCKNGKMGRGGGREGKHSLSLIKYGFCRSNAIYSASLSFSMFVFLLTPFDT